MDGALLRVRKMVLLRVPRRKLLLCFNGEYCQDCRLVYDCPEKMRGVSDNAARIVLNDEIAARRLSVYANHNMPAVNVVKNSAMTAVLKYAVAVECSVKSVARDRAAMTAISSFASTTNAVAILSNARNAAIPPVGNATLS